MGDETKETRGGETQDKNAGASPFLNVATDLLDKLTDVLNFGRMLSIGIPGFVATFGLLMLLSLLSPMPTQCVAVSGTTSDTAASAKPTGLAKPADTTTATAPVKDTVAAKAAAAARAGKTSGVRKESLVAKTVAAVSGSKAVGALKESLAAKAVAALSGSKAVGASKESVAANAAPTDSDLGRKTTGPLFYEQNHPVRVLNDIDRIRFEFDSFRIVSKWYFLLFWLIGAIVVGSLISQWGYSNLRNRDSMFRIWNEIIQSFRESVHRHREEDWKKVLESGRAFFLLHGKDPDWKRIIDHVGELNTPGKLEDWKWMLESAKAFFSRHESNAEWNDILRKARELYRMGKEEDWERMLESAREFVRKHENEPEWTSIIGSVKECFHCLTVRAQRENALSRITKLVEEVLHVRRREPEKEQVMFSKPRHWKGLRRKLNELRRIDPTWHDEYERLLVKLQRARDSGSDNPSWSMLHLPLLRQNMTGSQVITYHDYLLKEYWRFAEFAVNCPVAVWVFCLTLGLYFCSLSIMYPSHAWILGGILGVVGLVVYLIAYFWWNPNVAFTSFHLYVQARSGMITGLSLFPAKNPDVDSPMVQKMYTNCPEFQKWYCDAYWGKLNVEDRAACNGPTTCLPRSDTPATRLVVEPRAGSSVQPTKGGSMTTKDEAPVRQKVAAAMCNVGGSGPAPETPSDVDTYLAGVTIREFLGVGATTDEMQQVADLLVFRTSQYLSALPGFPKGCALPDSKWLMGNLTLRAEDYAKEVWKAVSV